MIGYVELGGWNESSDTVETTQGEINVLVLRSREEGKQEVPHLAREAIAEDFGCVVRGRDGALAIVDRMQLPKWMIPLLSSHRTGALIGTVTGGHGGRGGHIAIHPGDKEITLDGQFTAAELRDLIRNMP